MEALLLAPSLILGGILWWVLREQRVTRRDQIAREADWTQERAELLQRIQAPQAAIEEHERRAYARTIREAAPGMTAEEREAEAAQTRELERVGTVVNGDSDGQ